MKIAFKISKEQLDLFTKHCQPGAALFFGTLNSVQDLIRFDPSAKASRFSDFDVFLTFRGSHNDFFEYVDLIKLIHRDNVGSVIRPVVYVPDDVRLKWDENLATYLETRATREEYNKEHFGKSELPKRFIQSADQTPAVEEHKPSIVGKILAVFEEVLGKKDEDDGIEKKPRFQHEHLTKSKTDISS